MNDCRTNTLEHIYKQKRPLAVDCFGDSNKFSDMLTDGARTLFRAFLNGQKEVTIKLEDLDEFDKAEQYKQELVEYYES